MATVAEELLDVLARLPADQQRRVLEYARDLERASAQGTMHPRSIPPPGKSPEALLAFRPTVAPEEVEEMKRIIEEEFERIEPGDDVSL